MHAGYRRPWLAGCARGLLLAVGSSPVWVPVLRGIPGVGAVAGALDAWFAFQCERDTGRSLFLFGGPMPVCARCFGIYFGLFLGALVLRPRLRSVVARVWIGVACLIMVLDVLTEALSMRPGWAPLRAFTGMLLSYPVAISLVWAARDAQRSGTNQDL
jgi:uncharacterized membrane protein